MTDPNSPKQGQPAMEENLTDHSYDGIQEYDNPLPGWWVATFWGSIVWSFFYFGWYTAGPGDGMLDEYSQQVAVMTAQKEAATDAKLSSMGEVKADAASMLKLMADKDVMESQHAVWIAKCSACHTTDGRGMVGPNMKDDSYINVKKIEDIISIVENGVIEKGMTPFKGQLTDREIILISAYTASLRGTELDPEVKLPVMKAQGEVIPPWPAE